MVVFKDFKCLFSKKYRNFESFSYFSLKTFKKVQLYNLKTSYYWIYIVGYSFDELDMKINDYFEINNKQFKIKSITSLNIVLSDGTLIPIDKTKFILVNKINTISVYKKNN